MHQYEIQNDTRRRDGCLPTFCEKLDQKRGFRVTCEVRLAHHVTAQAHGIKMTREDETIFALRTTANREDQVMDFVASNAVKKKLEVYSVVRPHGMRGYIFIEAATKTDAEQVAFNIPYARGILAHPVKYSEIEHMLEQVKHDMNIQKNDIVEIISGPFKRENAKVTRIDKTKEEVVVELLEAAVPIPITVKMDAVKVVRRETESAPEEEETGEETL